MASIRKSVPAIPTSYALRAVSAIERTARSEQRRGVLLIPPSGPGSVGDEAMVSALAVACGRAGIERVDLLARPGHKPWPQGLGCTELRWPEQRGFSRARAIIRMLDEYDSIFVIGADCIDGHYSLRNSLLLLTLADIAARRGAVTTITGASYKRGAAPATARAMRRLHPSVRCCAREQESARRMRETSGREPVVVADCAFLLPPADPPAEVGRWINAQRSAGRVLLGVNVNRQVLSAAGGNRADDLVAAVDSALLALMRDRDDLALLLIPHDYRSTPSDLEQATQIHNTLKCEVGDRVNCVTGERLPGELKGAAARLDAVFTGRMHLAIAALGSGVPVGCVAYQDKFEGLFAHFEIEPPLLAPSEALDSAQVRTAIESLLANRAAIADQVAQRLPAVMELARTNLPEHLRQPLRP